MLVALILSIAAQTAPSTTSASTPPPSTARASIELLSALSAQGTTSNVDTALTSWLGVRVGGVNTDQGGLFFGGDGTVSVGVENAGTADVAYGRQIAALTREMKHNAAVMNKLEHAVERGARRGVGDKKREGHQRRRAKR